jgi:hypothetical protein
LGLWPAPDPKESFKIPKIDDDGTLSIRNFVLMMVPWLKSTFEPKCLVAYVAWGHIEATKIEKNAIWALWYSIDQQFHVDNENTRKIQFWASVRDWPMTLIRP